ncbi:dienelactone hydrolase family protein [Niveibacterium sp. 24ML]|uniref:dienelactone hydrolase family protein n=1 Tax=Niveibacterium sp. 24ML TaxID=2985512 RepID=UPI00226F94E2|nr:dienelactone hydrolase family protein [Niveibacterium sp. 24ML]MCX9157305.1 dienelactone hydrolase family protein [Niveibacterium sp. 24ML]
MEPTQKSPLQSEFDSLAPALKADRRGFIAGMVATGFALAVQPVAAQTVIKTPADGLVAGPVDIPAGDITMRAYRAMPAGKGPFPVVMVVEEIFGIHEWIQDICRRLARAGYLAVAPDLFARQGDPTQYDSIPKIFENVISKVPDAQVMRDLDATAAWAATQGGDAARLGVTGFCWGGRITWLYATHNPKLKAGVAWYGRVVGQASALTPKAPSEVLADLKAPVLGLYGGKDKGIPVEQVEKMQAALKAAGSKSEIRIYPEADHGFLADYRPSFNADAAADAWPRALEWLKRHGV